MVENKDKNLKNEISELLILIDEILLSDYNEQMLENIIEKVKEITKRLINFLRDLNMEYFILLCRKYDAGMMLIFSEDAVHIDYEKVFIDISTSRNEISKFLLKLHEIKKQLRKEMCSKIKKISAVKSIVKELNLFIRLSNGKYNEYISIRERLKLIIDGNINIKR
jgi:hypothetical protein